MKQFIPENIKQNIIESSDIVEIISRYVKLRKAGSNFKARCPFHNEKTPSFVVSPAKQIFKCFGCGASGNSISFLMKIEGLNFIDTLIVLARENGIEIPQKQYSHSNSSKSILKLNKFSSEYFQSLLKKHWNKIKEITTKRKISEEMIETLMLGYAEADFTGLKKFLNKKGFDDKILLKSGLIKRSTSGRYYDVFRDRLIFPILSYRGEVLGFAGRALNDEIMPKYLNSPDTQVFKKRQVLYGLNISKKYINKEKKAIIVEGYMDFLRLFSSGIKNCVASMGTSISSYHVKILKRYSEELIFSYDSDNAGKKATIRCIDEILGFDNIKCSVIELDSGDDPDSYIISNGFQKYLDKYENADEFMRFKLKYLIQQIGVDDIYKKIKIINLISKNISNEKNFIIQNDYINYIAGVLGINESDLRKELGKNLEEKKHFSKKKSIKNKTAFEKAIDNIILFVINDRVDNVSEYFELIPERYVEVIEKIISLREQRGITRLGHLLDWFDGGQRAILENITSDGFPDFENEESQNKILEDSVRTLRKVFYSRKKKEIKKKLDKEMSSGKDVEKIKRLQKEFFNILKFEKMK